MMNDVDVTHKDKNFTQDDNLIETKLLSLTASDKKELVDAQLQLSRKLESSGLNFEGKSYPVSIRPLIMSDKMSAELKAIGEHFATIFDKFARAWIESTKIREYFPTYKKSEHFIFSLPNHVPLTRIFRLDGLFSTDGVYQILETNTDCPGGVIQNGLAGKIWSTIENPLLKDHIANVEFQPFVKDPDLFLKELLTTHQERTGKTAKRAAIVTYKGRFKNEITWMANGLNRLGVPTEIIDASLLKRKDGHLINQHGEIIDLAYNKLDLRDLVDQPEVEEYLTAAYNGEVTFINPLICQWPLADKAIMAILSDREMISFLDDDDKEFCIKHIPWTRVVKDETTISMDGDNVKLFDWAIKNKQRLVLKPSNATRGEGLLIGPFTESQEWKMTLKQALDDNETWIVQEYIRGRLINAVHPDIGVTDPMWSGIDTYVFGGKFAGFQARASFDPVMNVGRRGILLPVAIVKENIK